MRRRGILVTLLIMVAQLVFGCATVQPWQREHLADRIMDPQAIERERGMERHWMETREGAMGGPLGAGGGCACN